MLQLVEHGSINRTVEQNEISFMTSGHHKRGIKAATIHPWMTFTSCAAGFVWLCGLVLWPSRPLDVSCLFIYLFTYSSLGTEFLTRLNLRRAKSQINMRIRAI